MWWLLLMLSMITIAYRVYIKLSSGVCKCGTKMDGKVIIITGANTGIGFETAKNLAARGAKVILACRNIDKATTARDKIINTTGNKNVIVKQLDLCSFKSIRNFTDDILKNEPKLDVLINNAGTGILDNSLTEDMLPIEVQANYFGPFLLTILLLPLLKKSAPSRIVNVSSIMHWLGKIDIETFDKQAKGLLDFRRVYSNTKLANILFTNKLSVELKGTGVTANALHPGAVSTDIFRNRSALTRFLISIFMKNPLEGAQTTIHLAVSPKLANTSGKYFSDCREARVSENGKNVYIAEKLWKLSEQIVFNISNQ